MTDAATAPPSWFLNFWEENCHRWPMFFRGEASMLFAWQILSQVMEYAARYSKTQAGMKAVIGFAKIQAMMVESQIIANSPDPSPEQVEQAVRRLVERSKQ